MRRTIRLGTFFTLVGVAVFSIIGSMRQPGRGSMTFQADSSGKLMPVEREASVQGSLAPPPPLWKPEPSLLLKHSKELSLTVGQMEGIGHEDRSWQTEKARLTEAMAGYQPAATNQRLEGISSGLQAYSTLSRTYDAAREQHWTAALATLTPAQKQSVERMRAPGGSR